MKKFVLQSKLNEAKGRLKQKFASLTDDDFLHEEGRKEELFGKHQALFFQTKEEFERIRSSL